MSSIWDKIIKEKVSDSLRESTLKKAEIYTSLNENYRNEERRNFFRFTTPAMGFAAAVAGFIGYQKFYKNTETNEFSEDAMFLVDLELEFTDDLDILDNLELLEDLETLEDWEES